MNLKSIHDNFIIQLNPVHGFAYPFIKVELHDFPMTTTSVQNGDF